MEPTLRPGDRIIAVRHVRPRPGTIVVARHPQTGDEIIKRVDRCEADLVHLVGDHAAASTDSRHFGPISRRNVLGRAVYRYHPPSRVGRL